MRNAARLALVLTLVFVGCGEKPEPAPTTNSAATVRNSPTPAPGNGGFADAVWLRVRDDARVPIYERPGGERVARAGDGTQFGSPMSFGVLGSRDGGDWIEVTTALGPPNEPLWVRADPDALRPMRTPWSIDVDLGKRRLVLRRDGELVRAANIAVGAADSPTPTGRFAITDVIVRDLDHEIYGCCALALSAHQPSLPAGWIGGDRVAIHGTPEANGAVGVAASAGCIRVRDRELIPIVRRAGLGTPVDVSR